MGPCRPPLRARPRRIGGNLRNPSLGTPAPLWLHQAPVLTGPRWWRCQNCRPLNCTWVKPEEASPRGRGLLRPGTTPQLPGCPLPTMIGCQVLAPAIGLAARPCWAHEHAVDPAGGNRWGRGQAEPESEVSWVCQDCAAHQRGKKKKNRLHSRQGTGLRTTPESTRGVQ